MCIKLGCLLRRIFMRYYVVSVQHNKEKDTENRSVPKAFDTEL